MATLPVLTRRQRSVLKFITAFIGTEGYAPSLEEIKDHLGLSAVSTVHEHIERLIEKGYLTRGWNQSRSITLTPAAVTHRTARLISLLGTVAAGSPIEAVPDPEEIAIPESFMGRGETFALRARGDSMVDAGILDGDILVVQRTERADNGALVIALIAGTDVAVKHFFKRGKRIELHSANDAHPPMIFDARDVTLQGIVIGLLRNYR